MSKEWTAWMIEDGAVTGPIRYRTIGDDNLVSWTTDPLKALHFCRRDDAELFAREDPEAEYIREHLFLGDDEDTDSEIVSALKKVAKSLKGIEPLSPSDRYKIECLIEMDKNSNDPFFWRNVLIGSDTTAPAPHTAEVPDKPGRYRMTVEVEITIYSGVVFVKALESERLIDNYIERGATFTPVKEGV